MIKHFILILFLLTSCVSCSFISKDINYLGHENLKPKSNNISVTDTAKSNEEFYTYNDDTVIVSMSIDKNKVISLGPPYLPVIPYFDFGSKDGFNTSTGFIYVTAKSKKLIELAKINNYNDKCFNSNLTILKNSYYDINKFYLINKKNDSISIKIDHKKVISNPNNFITIVYSFNTKNLVHKTLKWTKKTGISFIDNRINLLKFRKESEIEFETALHGS